MIDYVLFLFGLTWSVQFTLYMIGIFQSLISKSDLLKYGKGSWVIITGSTDGIGKGFAYSLAKQGFNIVSISRTPSKLSELSTDLTSKYGIKVLDIAKDFSECTKDPIQFYSDIYSKTSGLDVSILINNVGTGKNKTFLKHSLSQILIQIALNTFSLTYLSRYYINQLASRKENGLIINVSSVIAELPAQTAVMYSSTKSFDLVFSEVLSTESRVDVMTVQPGFVKTQLIKNVKKPYVCISVEDCIDSILKATKGGRTTSGHWKHEYVRILLKFFRLAR